MRGHNYEYKSNDEILSRGLFISFLAYLLGSAIRVSVKQLS